ncbi:DUF4232 domain-containing protein [Streptomyces spiramenti]|uniref:DUF4232 domain-containing protein n=1 Tax=Streptomyces spiramenti TaxID=2720606 RepID=A0ABX1AHL3_9ACTN|nr:DUF4232 domain-containing protein [Streptomyces spiramenti]NJP65359.1 DUF4232 domain-containing protein [Streptomyces spiramenti]
MDNGTEAPKRGKEEQSHHAAVEAVAVAGRPGRGAARRRPRGALAVAAVAVLALTASACGSGDDDNDGGTDQETTEPDTGDIEPDPDVEEPGLTGGTDDLGAGAEGGAFEPCGGETLEAFLTGPEDNDAGSTVHTLEIMNLGAETCELAGFPTVTPFDAEGNAIGEPASEEAQPIGPLALDPDQSVDYELRTVGEDSATGECGDPAAELEIVAPGESEGFTIVTDVGDSTPPVVCDDLFEIGVADR